MLSYFIENKIRKFGFKLGFEVSIIFILPLVIKKEKISVSNPNQRDSRHHANKSFYSRTVD